MSQNLTVNLGWAPCLRQCNYFLLLYIPPSQQNVFKVNNNLYNEIANFHDAVNSSWWIIFSVLSQFLQHFNFKQLVLVLQKLHKKTENPRLLMET